MIEPLAASENREVQSQRRRVLLLYISKVSGHRQATLAIQRSLHQLCPAVEAPAINGFGYTYPYLEKLVNAWYMAVIRHRPQIWESLYDNPRLIRSSRWIQKLLYQGGFGKIRSLLNKHRPETIVCTQAFPCGMVAAYKQAKGIDIRLIAVLTDFAPHGFWIHEGVDYYVVPSEEIRDRFIAKGVEADRIKVYGIPIRLKFAAQLDKGPLYEKLSLTPDRPTVLIMGGGQGLGPIQSVVEQLDRLNTPLQIIVLSGTNRFLIEWLHAYISTNARKRIVVFEYTTHVDELMEVADVIVTKPGGMTTSECLAKGLPMVVVNPLPGQERRNLEFLLRRGIAIHVPDLNRIGAAIDELFRDPDRLAAMSAAAKAASRPYAALDVARLILGMDRADMNDRPLLVHPA